MRKISYAGYWFQAEVIHQAIGLYLRFTLSFRDGEDLLAERGIAVSYESVHRWANHFGPQSVWWRTALSNNSQSMLSK
jgi:putative transposase